MKIWRYEARLNKKDEALFLQNKVSSEQAVKIIENAYGPFSDEEIEHYRKALTRGGSQIINKTTSTLVGYVFYKDLGDPETWKSIPSSIDYIKLIIAAKNMLLGMGMILLPWIISSKVVRQSSKKAITKNNATEIRNAELYNEIQNKYQNPKVLNTLFELIGTIKSSQFEIIDWNRENNCPGKRDGELVPMISDNLDDELLMFSLYI